MAKITEIEPEIILDLEDDLSYHQHMPNEIDDQELLQQLLKLRYHEPVASGVNPYFDQEWIGFTAGWEPGEPPNQASVENTHRINEMQQELHSRLDELFPLYEGKYVGLCDGSSQLFSAETAKELTQQMAQSGGKDPSIIIYVPSRYKQFLPDCYRQYY